MIETDKVFNLVLKKYLDNIENVRDNGTILDLFSLVKFCYDNLEENQTEFIIEFENHILEYLENNYKGSFMPENEFNRIKEKLKNV